MSEPLPPKAREELFKLAEDALALACEALTAVGDGVFSTILRTLPTFDARAGATGNVALASQRWHALLCAYDAMHGANTIAGRQDRLRLLAARETILHAKNLQRAVGHLAEGQTVNMALVRSDYDQAVRYGALLAPAKTMLKIRPDQVWLVVGLRGKTIAGIVEKTGVTIDVEDDGSVVVASSDPKAMAVAIAIIKGLTAEVGTPCPT